jgi:predicted phage baseplate assembly protein
VQWQAVPDFYGSSGGDRHYILDYLTGQIYFGNDQAGRTPPQGRNNVRISYRTGGGSQGNRPAGNILQLKSAVPYVNGVTNLEPARGGADAESLEQIKQRGPKQIRHRFRAVTVQDYEDLAYEASSEVARAKAFAADSDPINRRWLAPGATALSTDAPAGAGQVVLVVVPDRAIPQPIPSLTLINQVEDYILSRCGGGIKVQVGGPQWRKVTIRVEVVPASLEAAIGLDTQVVERLNQFLHPLTGGSQGQGWAFGRMPQTSDIYALLGGIAGVDHARVLDIDIPAVSDSAAPPLVFSGDHQVSLTLPEVNR